MRVLYPGLIGIWRCWCLWGEENWRTLRKSLGVRQEPVTNSWVQIVYFAAGVFIIMITKSKCCQHYTDYVSYKCTSSSWVINGIYHSNMFLLNLKTDIYIASKFCFTSFSVCFIPSLILITNVTAHKLIDSRPFLTEINNIGTQGVQELFFCELKGFGDSRIKSMTCKMSYSTSYSNLTCLQINIDIILFSNRQFDSFFDTTNTMIGVTCAHA